MATAAEIQNITELIRREFAPQKIILFDSHLWGNPDIDSDVDLLVVLPFQGKSWLVAVDIRERLNSRIPLELLVRIPEQLQERLACHDTFITEKISDKVFKNVPLAAPRSSR